MDLPFLLDRYKWELDRREKISAAVNFPVTILILIFSLLGALLPKLQLVAPQVVLFVVGLFSLAGGCGVVSLWYFIRSYQGSKYSGVSRTRQHRARLDVRRDGLVRHDRVSVGELQRLKGKLLCRPKQNRQSTSRRRPARSPGSRRTAS